MGFTVQCVFPLLVNVLCTFFSVVSRKPHNTIFGYLVEITDLIVKVPTFSGCLSLFCILNYKILLHQHHTDQTIL